MMKETKERAIVFIDGNNLYMGLKDCYRIERLDLESFCRHLTVQHDLRAIYYADANFIQQRGEENYRSQQSYFSHLRKVKGLIFRRGYYSKWVNPPVEKRSDVYLAVDMVDLCHRDEFDLAYLVSGDADLTPAVDVVIREGKKVINVYFDTAERNSYALRSHCQSHFLEITETLAKQFQWETRGDRI